MPPSWWLGGAEWVPLLSAGPLVIRNTKFLETQSYYCSKEPNWTSCHFLPTSSHNQFSTIKTMRLQVHVFFRSLGRTWSLKISAWIDHNHWNLLSIIRWALSKLNGFEVIYSESFELNQPDRKGRWFGAIKMRPGNSHLNWQMEIDFEPRY